MLNTIKQYFNEITATSLLTVSSLISSGANANTIIDFENIPQQSGTSLFFVFEPIQQNGFTVSNLNNSPFTLWQQQGAGSIGSNAVFSDFVNGGDTSIITQDNSGTFRASSVDLASINIGSPTEDFTAVLFAMAANGDMAFTQECDVILGQTTTCNLNDQFDIASLHLQQGANIETAYQFDNVQLSNVPVPASALLLGSALAGLAGFGATRKPSLS